MLQINEVSTFYGTVQALYGASLEVEEGELIALVGANGAGKSTMLRTISGLNRPASGSVNFMDECISNLRTYDVVKRGIVLCPERRHVFPDMTVYENLLMGAFTRQDDKSIKKDIDRMCDVFPILKEREKQLAGTLSGGQQQMLAIARALMARPKLLLLDEPSLGLAPIVIQDIAQIIEQINADGVTILLVEQNVKLALRLAKRAYVLENGRIRLSGNSSDLVNNTEVKKLYLGG